MSIYVRNFFCLISKDFFQGRKLLGRRKSFCWNTKKNVGDFIIAKQGIHINTHPFLKFVPLIFQTRVHSLSISTLNSKKFSTSNTSNKGKGGFETIIKYLLLFPIAYGSLLGGASITHSILKPDLTIPDLEEEIEMEEATKTTIKIKKDTEK